MISLITKDETEEWNRIVRGFSDFDLYYLAEYTKAFAVHGDGEPILFYYQQNDLKGINVVMKRDISVDKKFHNKIPAHTYFDIATPYGYGGFLLQGEVTEENLKLLDTEYSSFCKEMGIVSEFVRFHPLLNNAEKLSQLYEIVNLGKTITVNLESKNQIWNDLKGKNRNQIRKAINDGVKIYWGRNSELIDNFVEMYNATMKQDNAESYYYFEEDFYKSILEDLKYNSMIYYAIYKCEIISVSILLFANRVMHYHLSASKREYRHLSSTNLLLYEAACWGTENGFNRFHLGGGLGSQEDNLFKFKKAFNEDSDTRFSIGKKIFHPDKYEELIKIRKNEKDASFNEIYFPKYRG